MVRARSAARRLALGALLLPLATSCAQRAWMRVPPQFPLEAYPRIGVLAFEGVRADVAAQATDRFQERLLQSGASIQLVELPRDPSLANDPERLAKLAADHRLDALFVGEARSTEPAPTFGIASSLIEVTARMDVTVELTARLVDPADGSILWMRSAQEAATVAQGGLDSEGLGSIGVADATEVRSELIRSLAVRLTDDFYAQYYRKAIDDIPPTYRVTYPDGVEVWVPPDTAD